MENGLTESARKATIELLRVAKTEHKFQDSGGYQIFTSQNKGRQVHHNPEKSLIYNDNDGINITPKHVIDVARQIQPTLMTSLDYPLRALSSKKEQEYEFVHRKGINIMWAKETAELRERYCPDTRLFIPLQSYTVDQMEVFLDELSGVNYDGVALIARALDINQLTLCLCSLYQRGIKQVHMLGTSEFLKMALFAYMARNHFDWVSFDATTWRMSADHGAYKNHNDLYDENIWNVDIDEAITNDCPCPWCAGKSFTAIKNLPQTDRISFLRCHNFWVIDQAARDLFDSAASVSDLERTLKNRARNRDKVDPLCNALTIFEMLKDGDIKDLKALLQ